MPEEKMGRRIVIKGSDTLLPLAQQWTEAFRQRHPEAQFTLTGGGSSTGITALINGTCDIANASRRIRPRELHSGTARNLIIKEYEVARDGLAIIVHPSNPITSLSVDDLRRIYIGTVTNWKELGGPNRKITPIGRDPASAAYGFFQEHVIKNPRLDMRSMYSTYSTPSNHNIANNPGGVAYVGIAYAKHADNRIKVLPLSSMGMKAPIAPTEANIRTGKYPISRSLYNYTRGTPIGLVSEYLKFVRGREGQRLVAKVGYVPLQEWK